MAEAGTLYFVWMFCTSASGTGLRLASRVTLGPAAAANAEEAASPTPEMAPVTSTSLAYNLPVKRADSIKGYTSNCLGNVIYGGKGGSSVIGFIVPLTVNSSPILNRFPQSRNTATNIVSLLRLAVVY